MNEISEFLNSLNILDDDSLCAFLVANIAKENAFAFQFSIM